MPDKGPLTQTHMLTPISDVDMLAYVRRYLPLIPEATLLAHIRVFRQICHQNRVVLLQAQPFDFSIITTRRGIGWVDAYPHL